MTQRYKSHHYKSSAGALLFLALLTTVPLAQAAAQTGMPNNMGAQVNVGNLGLNMAALQGQGGGGFAGLPGASQAYPGGMAAQASSLYPQSYAGQGYQGTVQGIPSSTQAQQYQQMMMLQQQMQQQQMQQQNVVYKYDEATARGWLPVAPRLFNNIPPRKF